MKALAGIVLLLASSAAAAQQPVGLTAPVVNDANVTRAIDTAVKYLYSRVNEHGIWDRLPPPKVLGRNDPPANVLDVNWPGQTALVLYALAAAGQEADPRFHKALDWLMDQKIYGTYALALRLSLIHQLREPKKYTKVLRRDTKYLLKGARTGKWGAMWFYLPPPVRSGYSGVDAPGDYSNVNYAVLGLWAASDELYEVPTRTWLQLERAWTKGQDRSGGWAYFPVQYKDRIEGEGNLVTPSMTTAGIASLYLIIDNVHARRGGLGAFRTSPSYKSIEKGLAWMDEHFTPARNEGRAGWTSYYYYNVERVAAAAGLRAFGKKDWFRHIAAYILARQSANGSIPGGMAAQYGGLVVDTAFGLLFLTKGSAPVIFNKLRHGGDWDNHLRELASMTGWLARQSERPANWQVVDIDAPVLAWTNSRILYVAGTKPLDFNDEHRKKLKQFVQLGGTLLFHPDSATGPFCDSPADQDHPPPRPAVGVADTCAGVRRPRLARRHVAKTPLHHRQRPVYPRRQPPLLRQRPRHAQDHALQARLVRRRLRPTRPAHGAHDHAGADQVRGQPPSLGPGTPRPGALR